MVNILQISQFLMNSDKFSSNSDRIVDRILSRKVRMVRSLGDRTFQLSVRRPRSWISVVTGALARMKAANVAWLMTPSRATSIIVKT